MVAEVGTPPRRYRIRVWLTCWLGLLLSQALGAQTVPGGWRAVQPGDSVASARALPRTAWQPFTGTALQQFPAQPLGSWIMLWPSSRPAGEERLLSLYPISHIRFTVEGLQGPLTTLAMTRRSTEQQGHGRLAWPLPPDWPAGAPLLLKIEPGQGLVPPVSFAVQDVRTFWQQDSRWLMYASASMAVMLAMALMALFFAVLLRERTFAWYTGYLLCYAGIQLLQSGVAFYPLGWDWLVPWRRPLGIALVVLAVLCATLFAIGFCELKQRAPLWRLLLLGLCGTLVLTDLLHLLPSPVLHGAAEMLLNPLLMLGSVMLLLAALLAAFRGARHAWYFLAGWTPLLVLTTATSAQFGGALLDWPWLSDASLAAGAFEAVVLSLGLADRALIARRDRDTVRQLANTDALTHVLNRRGWLEGVRHAMEAGGTRPLAVLFMDLDHFKALNDSQGHAAGDRALVAVADTLRTELRPTDLLGRHGGEEFVAMLADVSAEQAQQIATRLCRRVHRLEIATCGPQRLTISIGIAMRQRGDSVEQLIERADQAMYAAKLAGRNRVQVACIDAPTVTRLQSGRQSG